VSARRLARTLAAPAACLAAAVLGGWLLRLAYGADPQWMLDFQVYRAGGLAVRHGAALYDVTATAEHLPFTYPPFAALVFAPFAAVSLAVSGPVSVVVNLLLLQLVVWRVLREEGTAYGWRIAATAGVALAAMWLPPVRWTLQLGQVNIALMALVVLDLVLTARPGGRWRRWAGVGVGVAAGIKLAPGIFLLYLLLRRRYRAFATGTAAFAATVAAGFAVVPGDSARYWGGVFLDASRTAVQVKTSEQDLRAVLVRALHGAPGVLAYWIPVAVAVLAFGMAVVVRLDRRGDPLMAVLACAGVALLVSPVSWEHHWVWAVPLAVALAVRAWTRRSVRLGALAVAVTAAVAVRPEVWGVPDPHAPLHLDPVQLVWSSWLAVVTFALLVLAWAAAGQRSATSAPG
jgi:alpha-1,2-mannosyltransferase